MDTPKSERDNHHPGASKEYNLQQTSLHVDQDVT